MNWSAERSGDLRCHSALPAQWTAANNLGKTAVRAGNLRQEGTFTATVDAAKFPICASLSVSWPWN